MFVDKNDIPKQDYLVLCNTITYNQSPYIIDTMNGLCLQQTNFPFVCYIVDDASTDGEQDVIKDYLNEHFQMEAAEHYELELANVIVAKHNTNPTCTFAVYLLKRNLWKEPNLKTQFYTPWKEKCKYVAWCEGDDYWTDPLKLQKQVDFMESHPDVGLCYTDYGKCSDTKAPYVYGVFSNGVAVPPKNYEEFLLCNSYIAPMTWMYRRDVWKELDLSWVRTDGTLVWALEFYMKSKVAYLPEITAVYREHMGSASKPITEAGFMRQYGGVLHTELEFVERYRDQIPADLEDKIRSKGYMDLLPHALLADDKDFIEEVKYYFEGKGIYFPQLLSMAEQLNKARSQAYHAWNSKAYRLGRAILDPIKKLKRK